MREVTVIPVNINRIGLVPLLRGSAGPQGNPGAPGTAAARYEHTQASAAATWVVNHNLGYKPTAVSVRSPGGVEVEADVVFVSNNQLTINFAAPYAGTVIVL